MMQNALLIRALTRLAEADQPYLDKENIEQPNNPEKVKQVIEHIFT